MPEEGLNQRCKSEPCDEGPEAVVMGVDFGLQGSDSHDLNPVLNTSFVGFGRGIWSQKDTQKSGACNFRHVIIFAGPAPSKRIQPFRNNMPHLIPPSPSQILYSLHATIDHARHTLTSISSCPARVPRAIHCPPPADHTSPRNCLSPTAIATF